MNKATKKAFETVVSYLHWNGTKSSWLTSQEWERVFVLGDGFGQITRTQARKMDYDWSHVRDSSDKAIADMHSEITAIIEEKLIEAMLAA